MISNEEKNQSIETNQEKLLIIASVSANCQRRLSRQGHENSNKNSPRAKETKE